MNGIGSGMGGPADVIFLLFAGGEIIQVLAGGGSIELECFQGILLNLGMRVVESERGQCGDGGRHLQHVCGLWHAQWIIASAKFQGPLRKGMVLVEIHPAFHAPREWALASKCESDMASDCEVRILAAWRGRKVESWLIAYLLAPNKHQAQALSMVEWLIFLKHNRVVFACTPACGRVSTMALSKYENAIISPGPEVLVALSQALELPPELFSKETSTHNYVALFKFGPAFLHFGGAEQRYAAA